MDQPRDQGELETLEEDERPMATSLPALLALVDQFAGSRLGSAASPVDQLSEQALLLSICSALDEYQEQSYLLDPFLERLVTPLISSLRDHVNNQGALASERVNRLTRLLYFFTKVRGPKTIPPKTLESATWETRYILLLWLSLVVLLPFSLIAATDDIVAISNRYLGTASKERDASVMVLARFYSRPDAELKPFLAFCQSTFSASAPSILLSKGLLDTLSLLLSLSSQRRLLPYLSQLLEIVHADPGSKAPKLVGRVGVLLAGAGSVTQEDELEGVVGTLLERISDADSQIRYSSAKYLARIAALLPAEMVSQLIETVLDLPMRNEATLHGGCLCIAEFARKRLLPTEAVPLCLGFIQIAIKYDVLRLSQSLGSAVRDSAAYALWSLARTLSTEEIAPYVQDVGTALVCASLFDREVHVRRAAGAAWQEAVGRWGIFENGIELLGILSFSAVGARSSAFVVAAPLVAQFAAYRPALIDHLVRVTLIHYDVEMRKLAGRALGLIVGDDENKGVKLTELMIERLASTDVPVRHGAFVALAALAAVVSSSALRERIFTVVASQSVPRSPLLLSALLSAIATSCTPTSPPPPVLPYLLAALKPSLHLSVHQAAACAFCALTLTFDCSAIVEELLKGRLEVGKIVVLEGGEWDGINAGWRKAVVDALVGRRGEGGIEGRREGVRALARIVKRYQEALDEKTLESIVQVLTSSFEDYTIDQRGDVGSWVRTAAIEAVPWYWSVLLRDSNERARDAVVGAVLKLALERLDGVREAAGKVLGQFAASGREGLRCPGELWDGMESGQETSEWRNYAWTAQRVLPFLSVPEYKSAVLEGMVLGITPHSNASTIIDFALALPSISHLGAVEYTLLTLVRDLVGLARRNFSANRLFVPCLTTLGLLFEAGGLDDLDVEELRTVLLVATRSLSQLKSWPRLKASVKILVSLLSIPSTASLAASKVDLFLQHQMPTLRQHTAEEIYAVVIGWEDAEELQTLLAETPWVERQDDHVVQHVVTMLEYHAALQGS